MEIEPFRQLNLLPDIASGAKPSGVVQPRMYRQAMIKDKDNNIYAVYGDRLKKGTPDAAQFPWQIYSSQDLKVKVRQGIINNKIQGNLNEEFTCSETCDIYAEASLTYSEDGSYATVVSHVVKKGTTPAAETGLRPAKVYLTIGNVVVEYGAITQILQFIRSYVSGSMVMGASNCTSQSRQWTWFVPSTHFG
jgi:hypothetical protein